MPKQAVEEGVLPAEPLMVLGSICIVAHLFLALIATLFASSGPWPMPNGSSSEALPPQFAITAGNFIAGPYQRWLKNTSGFRFSSIKQEMQEISFDASMKDSAGKVTARLHLPDPEAPGPIRYRQQLLAQQLGMDIQLPPQEAIILAPAGQKLPTVRWWQPDGDRRMVLRQDSPNAVPRNQTFMQPSPWQYVVAKSYVRHLSRLYPGSKVEIVRTWYDPLFPMVLIEDIAPTADVLRKFQSSYGELSQ